MATAVLLALTTLPMSAQGPKAERSVVGTWVLKSATVNGKPTPKDSKEFSGLLKSYGGVEIGALYKFRKGDDCVLNDVAAVYAYHTETRELAVHIGDNEDVQQVFDVKFVDKNMKLRFKERGKTVELLLAPDE